MRGGRPPPLRRGASLKSSAGSMRKTPISKRARPAVRFALAAAIATLLQSSQQRAVTSASASRFPAPVLQPSALKPGLQYVLWDFNVSFSCRAFARNCSRHETVLARNVSLLLRVIHLETENVKTNGKKHVRGYRISVPSRIFELYFPVHPAIRL